MSCLRHAHHDSTNAESRNDAEQYAFYCPYYLRCHYEVKPKQSITQNLAYHFKLQTFKDSIAKFKVCYIIDCHENFANFLAMTQVVKHKVCKIIDCNTSVCNNKMENLKTALSVDCFVIYFAHSSQ